MRGRRARRTLPRCRGDVLACLGAATVMVAGCDGGSGAAPGTTASDRDSAGVTVVDLGRVDYDALPHWRLADSATLNIGRLEGEDPYLLFRVIHARRLRDGSIALIDNFSEIRVFGPDGRHRWSQGRPGQGPGDYAQAIRVAEMRGDSLLVWDTRERRFTVLTPEGDRARMVAPETAEWGSVYVWGQTASDQVLMTQLVLNGLVHAGRGPEVEVPAEDGWSRLPWWIDVSLVGLDGRVTPLGRHRSLDYYRKGAGLPEDPPWSQQSVVAAAPGGMWYGSARDYELRRFRAPGDRPVRIVRWAGPDRTPSEELVKEYREWLAEKTENPGTRIITDAMSRIPEELPAYSGLEVDRVGRIWVRDFYPDPPEAYRWTILSADGTGVLGRLELPREVRPLDIGEDWMLVREIDEMEVEHVRLYPLVGPA